MTPEQLLARKRYLGASEAAAACALSPYMTPLELWTDKTSDEVVQRDSSAMEWGRRLELVVLKKYEEAAGQQVRGRQKFVVDREFPWMSATLDGLRRDRVVEVKTASRPDEWGKAEDAVPIHYLAQVHHQMRVTRKTLADLVVLIAGSDYRVYTIPFDRELSDMIVQREVEFWRCVETRTPPDCSTVADTNLRWPRHADVTVEATDRVLEAIQRLTELQREQKSMDKDVEQLQLLVRTYMAEASLLQYSQQTLATWRTQTGSRFDTTAFKAAHPELYAQFTKQTETRVFRLAKEMTK